MKKVTSILAIALTPAKVESLLASLREANKK